MVTENIEITVIHELYGQYTLTSSLEDLSEEVIQKEAAELWGGDPKDWAVLDLPDDS